MCAIDVREALMCAIKVKEQKFAAHFSDAGNAARSERQHRGELLVRVDELDQNPWLLNCANGTVDLKTGELRGHDPKDLITKLAPVPYDPDARSPLWDSVIRRALPDEQVRTYFQKLAGYTLT